MVPYKRSRHDVSVTSELVLRPPPHYKVLPPGEFDSMIVEPLPVCFESFTTTAYPFSRNVAMATNMVTKTKTED